MKPFELAKAARSAGFELITYDTIESTNDAAIDWARAGGRDRVWFVARRQTQGRGRHGRPWIAPPGSLTASLLLIDGVPIALTSQLGFVAGVALAHALHGHPAADQRLRLKWPNDIVFDEAKLGGILIEGKELAGDRFASIIGIGVNCASYPQGLPSAATALSEIGAAETSAEGVFLQLSGEFARWLHVFAGGAGFEPIRSEWLKYAAGIGAPIKVTTSKCQIAGRFETIDSRGRLILNNENGTVAIEAGDVVFGH